MESDKITVFKRHIDRHLDMQGTEGTVLVLSNRMDVVGGKVDMDMASHRPCFYAVQLLTRWEKSLMLSGDIRDNACFYLVQ